MGHVSGSDRPHTSQHGCQAAWLMVRSAVHQHRSYNDSGLSMSHAQRVTMGAGNVTYCVEQLQSTDVCVVPGNASLNSSNVCDVYFLFGATDG